jgi:hypothetical protein
VSRRSKDTHKRAWLKAHPERTAGWLADRLSDGFDIHHLDGDRDNNTPENLVLINSVDHMRLHGLPLELALRRGLEKVGQKSEKLLVRCDQRAAQKREKEDVERLSLGRSAYELIVSGVRLPEVGRKISSGRSFCVRAVQAFVDEYCAQEGLPTPSPPQPVELPRPRRTGLRDQK